MSAPQFSLCPEDERRCLAESAEMSRKEFHIAPMMNYTTREFRALIRILSRRAVVWTEMVVDDTILHTHEPDFHLGIDSVLEHSPIVCQIGGNNPELAAECSQIVQQYGYNEINLNCGCPSTKVANEREFGAALMKKATHVKAMISAMKHSSYVNIPVTIKARIGVVERDLTETCDMISFVQELKPVCRRFIVHARKVHLHGLNAKQNRSIPPLNYPYIFELCRRFPDCEFIINGGIKNLIQAKRLCYGAPVDETDEELKTAMHSVPCKLCSQPNGSCIAPLKSGKVPTNLRGCMLGRAVLENPSMFWDIDRFFYGERANPCQNRRDVLIKYCLYLEQIYPRRCCDDDELITFRYPSPCIENKGLTDNPVHCHICQPMYNDGSLELSSGENLITKVSTDEEDGLCSITTESADVDNNQIRRNVLFKRRYPGQKISSKLNGEAIKPVRGLFFGLSCNKKFRRACDDVISEKTIQNCGPGFLLRKALESVPDEFLDMPFVETDDHDADVLRSNCF